MKKLLFFAILVVVSLALEKTSMAEDRLCFMNREYIIVTPSHQKFKQAFAGWEMMNVRSNEEVGNKDASLSVEKDDIIVDIYCPQGIIRLHIPFKTEPNMIKTILLRCLRERENLQQKTGKNVG